MKRLAILLLFLLLALPCAAAAEGVTLSAPAGLSIGAFYNGTTLDIAGAVPAGSQVVLRFSGAPEAVAMKQKGKALGLLWMNRDTLHFDGVPRVFLLEASAPALALGPAGADLGLEGLAKGIRLEPATADRGTLLPELLKLKENEGLYREEARGVTLEAADGPVQHFNARLAIPSRLSPGAYTLEVFALRDGQILGQAAQPVQVSLQGMPALMADLAFNHALWYGILASVVAIISGLCIGLVFQSKGAH